MSSPESLRTVRTVIAEGLHLSGDKVNDDSSMESLSEWDSFGQLNILVALNKRFEGKAKQIPGLARATSVRKISALLEEHGVL